MLHDGIGMLKSIMILCYTSIKFQLIFRHSMQVLVDILMDQHNLPEEQKADIKSFLDTPDFQINPEMLKSYYSQLPKSDIRKLYEKYRLDFDLFGFTPDYFIKFGNGT